ILCHEDLKFLFLLGSGFLINCPLDFLNSISFGMEHTADKQVRDDVVVLTNFSLHIHLLITCGRTCLYNTNLKYLYNAILIESYGPVGPFRSPMHNMLQFVLPTSFWSSFISSALGFQKKRLKHTVYCFNNVSLQELTQSAVNSITPTDWEGYTRNWHAFSCVISFERLQNQSLDCVRNLSLYCLQYLGIIDSINGEKNSFQEIDI
ncbi:hypothetical protein L9F63_024895, partial [Diploptera punctata]